jgi:hypothetical protein
VSSPSSRTPVLLDLGCGVVRDRRTPRGLAGMDVRPPGPIRPWVAPRGRPGTAAGGGPARGTGRGVVPGPGGSAPRPAVTGGAAGDIVRAASGLPAVLGGARERRLR